MHLFAGWAGDRCSVNLCDHKECLNNGQCVAGRCICKVGYGGTYCQENVQCDGKLRQTANFDWNSVWNSSKQSWGGMGVPRLAWVCPEAKIGENSAPSNHKMSWKIHLLDAEANRINSEMPVGYVDLASIPPTRCVGLVPDCLSQQQWFSRCFPHWAENTTNCTTSANSTAHPTSQETRPLGFSAESTTAVPSSSVDP